MNEKLKPVEKIIQISSFGVEDTVATQCNYLITALTETGRVIISRGDGQWSDITGDNQPHSLPTLPEASDE